MVSDRVMLGVRIGEDLHRRLKLRAVGRGESLQVFVVGVLEEFLDGRESTVPQVGRDSGATVTLGVDDNSGDVSKRVKPEFRSFSKEDQAKGRK